MNRLFVILSFQILIGCNRNASNTLANEGVLKDSVKSDSFSNLVLNDSSIIEQVDDEMATFYVVIADTGKHYYALRKQMFEINTTFKLPIDTMNRYYNQRKKEIVLSETDEDEIYRGDYFPRRSASDFLSLEYLDMYYKSANAKTMALVAGIFEDEKKANELSHLLKGKFKTTFVAKASLFQGCMH
ncbi:MAG: hypothetical protein PSX81_03575 [bacterium]|nr:hypothetical protein [bacterium]